MELKLNSLAIITDSIFSNNTANYGGSLFVYDIDILIENSLFNNNSAVYGGAIYYVSKDK